MQPYTISQAHAATATAVQNSYIGNLYNTVTCTDELSGIGNMTAAISTNCSRLEQLETLYRSAKAKHSASADLAELCIKACFACLLTIGLNAWAGNSFLSTGPILAAPFILIAIAMLLISPTRSMAKKKRSLKRQVKVCAELQHQLCRKREIEALTNRYSG